MMTNTFLGLIATGIIALLVLQVILVMKKASKPTEALDVYLDSLAKQLEKLERTLQEELSRNREEAVSQAKSSREEVNSSLKAVSDSLLQHMTEIVKHLENQLEVFKLNQTSLTQASEEGFGKIKETLNEKLVSMLNDVALNAKQNRDEMGNALKGFADSFTGRIMDTAKLQKDQLEIFSNQLATLTKTNEEKLEKLRLAMEERLGVVQKDATSSAQQMREEMSQSLKNFTDSFTRQIMETSKLLKDQLVVFADQLESLTKANESKFDKMNVTVEERLTKIQVEFANTSRQGREETNLSLKSLSDSLLSRLAESSNLQKDGLELFVNQLGTLTKTSEEKFNQLRQSVEEKLGKVQNDAALSAKQGRDEMGNSLKALTDTLALQLKTLQEDNAKKLEQMRATVDEKLHATLEQRLGESFKLVSERLEQVHKGLGEMQVLASGVGDLKKVLVNVKARGTWGEVQLGNILEQILTIEQYAKHQVTKKGSKEFVEFAIKLPGREGDGKEMVWLPIDAKFPLEDYQRLMEAQEQGDVALMETASKQLEKRIKDESKDIREKYLDPPHTTDFGILYLPIEGLYAEVLRRPGLSENLQREFRVMVAGPTTLSALLNSLQMGFKTLAVEKRSSEVWTLLGAVKTDFGRFGEILDKTHKKLEEATLSIEVASQRSRVISKKLGKVQELPVGEAVAMLEEPEEK